MGDLPGTRVRLVRPFNCRAVDYAGPLLPKNDHGRTNRKIKSKVYRCFCVLRHKGDSFRFGL
jgi:hypothetical protein